MDTGTCNITGSLESGMKQLLEITIRRQIINYNLKVQFFAQQILE
jgi:hypothetical protein